MAGIGSRITPSTIWVLMIEGHDTNENQSVINDWVVHQIQILISERLEKLNES